jgi:hypothetical protein
MNLRVSAHGYLWDDLVENEFSRFWRESAAGSVLRVNKKRGGPPGLFILAEKG